MLYPPELGFDKTDHRVFPHKICVFSFGRWSVFFIWSVAYHSVGGRWFLWSVRSVVCGRSAFQSVVGVLCFDGRLFFSTMVGGRCSIQYLVGGRWHKVGGLWPVAGRWVCTTPW